MTNRAATTGVRILSVVAALGCAVTVTQANIILGFDPTTYTTGPLAGQDSWTVAGPGTYTVAADATAPSSPNVLSLVNPEQSADINRNVTEPGGPGKGLVSFFAKHDSGNTFSATAGITVQLHATLPGGVSPDRFFSAGFVRDDDRFIWNTHGDTGSDLGGQSANGTVIADTWYGFEIAYEFTPVTFDKTVDLKIFEAGSGTVLVQETMNLINNQGGRATMENISIEFAINGNTSTFYVDEIMVAVPEPGMLALLGIGGLVLGGLRRRLVAG